VLLSQLSGLLDLLSNLFHQGSVGGLGLLQALAQIQDGTTRFVIPKQSGLSAAHPENNEEQQSKAGFFQPPNGLRHVQPQ